VKELSFILGSPNTPRVNNNKNFSESNQKIDRLDDIRKVIRDEVRKSGLRNSESDNGEIKKEKSYSTSGKIIKYSLIGMVMVSVTIIITLVVYKFISIFSKEKWEVSSGHFESLLGTVGICRLKDGSEGSRNFSLPESNRTPMLDCRSETLSTVK
jgi:hypothetical protein